MEETENKGLQNGELEALSAMFMEDWKAEGDNTYSINISNQNNEKVYFQVTLPDSYPLCSPPTYQISAPWMNRAFKKKLFSAIDDIYREHIGESVLYFWIDTIQELIKKENCYKLDPNEINKDFITVENIPDNLAVISSTSLKSDIECDELPLIQHGETIIDRKSVFQAHVAKIVSEKQIKHVLEKLKQNRKIAVAKHNTYAYRISCPNKNTYIQNYDDDGEAKAGSGLLHLLQVLDVSEVLVVVTRWYGGIHLGSDRFKHYNNAARTLLCKSGFVKSEVRQEKFKVKKKGQTSKSKK